MTDVTPIETKTIESAAFSPAFDDLMRAFSAFKETNETRLGEVERRMTADVLTTDKLARIDKAIDDNRRAMDDLVLKSSRPALGGGAALRPGADREHKAAFDTYMRRGDTGPISALEAKALSVAVAADGGFLVPAEAEQMVNRSLRDVSPIRAIATVQQVSGSVYKKAYATTDTATGWVAETATRTQTNTPTLAELQFPTTELYAMPAATQQLLDDSAVDIDQWIAQEVRGAFAIQEGNAFVAGNGTNKPRGFLAYPTIANATWSWGNIGLINTGVAGAFPVAAPGDKLLDLTFALKAAYRANASFVMNRATVSVIRKMKDGDGTYLWQPSNKPGEPATLLGYPVVESEDMPSIATDALAIAFGDFRRGYLVVDRVGIRVLRDPYSAKPYVLFYTTKRVGGGVQDFDAIKLMKFGV